MAYHHALGLPIPAQGYDPEGQTQYRDRHGDAAQLANPIVAQIDYEWDGSSGEEVNRISHQVNDDVSPQRNGVVEQKEANEEHEEQQTRHDNSLVSEEISGQR